MSFNDRLQVLKAASMDLAGLCRDGALVQTFVAELAKSQDKANALAVEISAELATSLKQLEEVKATLKAKQAELGQAEKSLLAMRQHISDEKAALRKLIDGAKPRAA